MPHIRIAYFLNTATSINWGCQATSAGLISLIQKQYPTAEIFSIDLPKLSKNRVLRKINENRLANAILSDDQNCVENLLFEANFDPTIFKNIDLVYFNGEGAIHSKSGHLIRLMALLYIYKMKGAKICALSQSVDLDGSLLYQGVLCKVYSMIDVVTTREPVSCRELKYYGINAYVLPDGAYANPPIEMPEIRDCKNRNGLPKKYIAVTGSSALKSSSWSMVSFLLSLIEEYYKCPIVFMANAKTDIALAYVLEKKHDFILIKPPVKFKEAMAIIAGAYLVIGGRQHPNIFAAMHRIPFIAFEANTHKMEGVLELLNYPTDVLPWKKNKKKIIESFVKTDKLYSKIKKINPPKLDSLPQLHND